MNNEKKEFQEKMNNEEFKPKRSFLDRYGPNSLSDEDRERIKKEIKEELKKMQ